MPIRGIVFDKDGTLFDFEATWGAWAADLLEGLFEDRAIELAASVGFDLPSRKFAPDSPVIAETSGHLADLMLPHLPGWEKQQLISHMKERAYAAPLAPAAPLVPLMAGLRGRGLTLGVATNDDEASARKHLDRAGIIGSFDFIAGYDSGHGGKPAPGQLLAFAAATELNAADVAMIGDSLHDLHAGRAAGMRCVGVLTGPARAEDLSPHCDIVLPDISHLPGWLDSLPG